MRRSDSIKALSEALCKAQGEIKHAAFDSINPHFNSPYASLESVLDEAKRVLTPNNLSVTQLQQKVDGEWVLTTTLMHASGEWLEGDTPLLNDRKNMQGLGSAISYARRYSLESLLGIGEKDDDANTAVETRGPDGISVTDNDVEKMIRSFSKKGVSAQDLCDYFHLEDIHWISIEQMEQAQILYDKLKTPKDVKITFPKRGA